MAEIAVEHNLRDLQSVPTNLPADLQLTSPTFAQLFHIPVFEAGSKASYRPLYTTNNSF